MIGWLGWIRFTLNAGGGLISYNLGIWILRAYFLYRDPFLFSWLVLPLLATLL